MSTHVKTLNLDDYDFATVESISSEYAHQHPPPPPTSSYNDDQQQKQKQKTNNNNKQKKYKKIPNVQYLNSGNKISKKKTKKKKKNQNNKNKLFSRSKTPPPMMSTLSMANNLLNINIKLKLKLKSARSASPPSITKNGHRSNGSISNLTKKIEKYNYKNGKKHNKTPPLTADIAAIENGLKSWKLNEKSPMYGYGSKLTAKKDKKFKFNRKIAMKQTNCSNVKHIQNYNPDDDGDDNGSIVDVNDVSSSDSSLSIKSVSDLDNNSNDDDDDDNDDDGDNNTSNNHHQNVDKYNKIKMFNSLAYGLEDPMEHKTFEWVDSKYVHLLQLSTYSTVMGPNVQFVWKNTENYGFNKQQELSDQQHSNHTAQNDDDNAPYIDAIDEDDTDTDDTDKDDLQQIDNDNPYKSRPELTYHELEAWIAKQTLDCTSWKNKHGKTAPPPFTKKTMVAPEFDVVLCCIQFDSSLRALRNKQFNQYIESIHHHHSRNSNIHHTPRNNKTHSPNSKHHKTPSIHGINNNKILSTPIDNSLNNIQPNSSPYEHTGLTDDGSGGQLPTSSTKSYTSSRYSSPSTMNETLADYLRNVTQPLSFAAGLGGGMNINASTMPGMVYKGIDRHNQQDMDRRHLHNHHNNHNNGHNNHNNNNNNSMHHHIDDNEDPDSIGHYSLVLAVSYKYFSKFIDCLDAIEHWLYMIASQIRYLLALNKYFSCDQYELNTDINNLLNNNNGDDDDINNNSLDKLHTIIPFMTSLVPNAIFKFDQLFSATFYDLNNNNNNILSHITSTATRGLPPKISLFDTWFISSLDNPSKHRLSHMISSHLQTLGRTIIIGNNEHAIDRYISTLALFCTKQQKLLSRLSIKVDDAHNLTDNYIPELYLQGIVIPSIDDDYNSTIKYLKHSAAIRLLEEDLYLAPGPSTIILIASNNNNNEQFFFIRQTVMPHKFKQEQQNLLFQKLFYLKRRRNSASSYVYARKKSMQLYDNNNNNKITPPNHNNNKNITYLTPPHINISSSPPKTTKKILSKSQKRTLLRKEQKLNNDNTCNHYLPNEFKSTMNVLNENIDSDDDDIDSDDDDNSITAASNISHASFVDNNNRINNHLIFVEPNLSPMIATIVFGSFNIPLELKMTFIETQFRILLQKASEILLYIEYEQKNLLSFYDKTCHVTHCKEFKEQVPMEALYPQIMQKFESQLRSDLQITKQEDLYVLLSISEGFRPNLFSLMFGNPVFDIEVADILRYFLF